MPTVNQIELKDITYDLAVNGGNVNGAVNSANKLTTKRNIQVNLESTNAASFDGSSNISPGVTGTLPIKNGGTGATTVAKIKENLSLDKVNNTPDSEKSVKYATSANTAAKADYATSATNATNAENANYAASAGGVAWGNISGKPSSYTPAAHDHDDRYYTESEINTKLDGKASAWNNSGGTYIISNPSNTDYVAFNTNSNSIEVRTHNTQKTYSLETAKYLDYKVYRIPLVYGVANNATTNVDINQSAIITDSNYTPVFFGRHYTGAHEVVFVGLDYDGTIFRFVVHNMAAYSIIVGGAGNETRPAGFVDVICLRK